MALNCKWSARPEGQLCLRNLGHQTSQTTSDTFHHLQRLLHPPYQSLVCIPVVCSPLLKWQSLMCQKCSLCSSNFSMKMATKSHWFWWVFFLSTHICMTSVMVQSDPTLLSKVRQVQEPESQDGVGQWGLWGPNWLLGQPGINKALTWIAPLKSFTVCFLFMQHLS